MTTYTTSQVISAAAQGLDLGAAAILDSIANLQADLDALQPLAAAGKIASISIADPGFSVMEVTPVLLTADMTALSGIRAVAEF